MLRIRPAASTDDDAVWRILKPTFRAGDTYVVDRDISRADALAYWTGPDRETFVAEMDGAVLGTYYIRANQAGGGAHVCNCGYVTAPEARGKGVARAMCLHSLDIARDRGFRAMQFNFVVATNDGAVHLWRSLGFEIVGRLPEAFRHPQKGYVDALVMWRTL